MSRTSLTKRKAQKKGMVAAASAVGTGLAFAFIHPILGVIGLGATGYFTYKWLLFRGKWGLRF